MKRQATPIPSAHAVAGNPAPWRHAICGLCWKVSRPQSTPLRLVGELRVTERCCYCGDGTSAGIYLREDPSNVPCGGA
jgi:hypothetical protein